MSELIRIQGESDLLHFREETFWLPLVFVVDDVRGLIVFLVAESMEVSVALDSFNCSDKNYIQKKIKKRADEGENGQVMNENFLYSSIFYFQFCVSYEMKAWFVVFRFVIRLLMIMGR